MITSLLTNSAIQNVRGSGLPSDGARESERDTIGRGVERSEESAGSQRNSAARAGAVPPLTADAVLAIQTVDEASRYARAPEADDLGPEGNGNDRGAPEGRGTRYGSIDRTEEDTSPAAESQASANTDETSAAAPGEPTEQEGADDPDGLSEAEEKQVKELQQRDREVRAHEQAHARVGGAYAGAPSYTFQQGPDGKRYAIGGEVQIDTSTERTPEATVRKMQIVIRAATAPAEPSSQDLKVAQQARAQLAAAQAEARQEKADELRGDDEAGETATTDPNSPSDVAISETQGAARENADGGAGDRQRQDAAFAYQQAISGFALTASGSGVIV
ncbi:putative metalloprotease CJM1_0395 family protein [Roseibium sp.]|uniref:putative metalloprotease CJM1_0395 family protein n=1 Tax=Roseibium sp. TaxID=1936156 RepID=UPI003A96EFE7